MGQIRKILATALTFVSAIVISGALFWISGRFIRGILSKNYLTQILVGEGPIIGYNADGTPLYEEISLQGLFYYFGIMIFIIILTYLFYRMMIRKKKKAKKIKGAKPLQ